MVVAVMFMACTLTASLSMAKSAMRLVWAACTLLVVYRLHSRSTSTIRWCRKSPVQSQSSSFRALCTFMVRYRESKFMIKAYRDDSNLPDLTLSAGSNIGSDLALYTPSVQFYGNTAAAKSHDEWSSAVFSFVSIASSAVQVGMK